MMLRSGLCGDHFQNCLFYFTLKIVFMTLVVCLALLSWCSINLGKSWHFDYVAWWIIIVPVFLCIENTINPYRISNSICSNAASNIHYCLQTLILPALQWTNCRLLELNISKFDKQSMALFSTPQFLCFHEYLSCLALFPSEKFGFLAATLL